MRTELYCREDPGIEIAVRLRQACEAHDPSIDSHLNRVTTYACEIGRLMGLSDTQMQVLRFATPLHDLGKIGIPPDILNKPSQLTFDEMELVKSHTTIGYRMLSGSPWPTIQCAAQVALSHHEFWDGSGYPQGLKGEAIPLDARIVAVADVYDALISQRAYKLAWEEDLVIFEMRRMRGTKFDPAILDLFLDRVQSQPLSASQ